MQKCKPVVVIILPPKKYRLTNLILIILSQNTMLKISLKMALCISV